MASNIGFGVHPAGSQPGGFGTPATNGREAYQPFPYADGTLGDCRAIDPKTGDYVMLDGRAVGMSAIQQRVILTFKTELESSAVGALGQTLKSVDRITDDVVRRIQQIIELASERLTAAGVFELTGVSVVRPKAEGLAITIRWRDLTTGIDSETTLAP
jgi:hypothetical protein